MYVYVYAFYFITLITASHYSLPVLVVCTKSYGFKKRIRLQQPFSLHVLCVHYICFSFNSKRYFLETRSSWAHYVSIPSVGMPNLMCVCMFVRNMSHIVKARLVCPDVQSTWSCQETHSLTYQPKLHSNLKIQKTRKHSSWLLTDMKRTCTSRLYAMHT